MQDNLPELRDIHLPEGVSAFPPAYGWWVILASIIGLYLLYQLISIIRTKSKKLFALRMLKNVQSDNVVTEAVEISEILRRICVYKYKSAAVLSDKEWIDFLNSHSKSKISESSSEALLLINGPYISKQSGQYSVEDIASLRAFATAWIGENL